MIVKNRSLGPRHPKYLPPEATGYPCCGSTAHHDLGRTGKDDPVMMVARWDRKESS